MDRITRPTQPEEERYIFTEGIDYFKTGKTSIWGPGDQDTLKLLKRIKIRGKWLNLAAGDWGYTPILLEKVSFVVASDIDESALSKLWHTTLPKYRKKLETKVFNIVEKFPLKDEEFDGVFCTGFLHLLPKKVLKKTLLEIDRVLKPRGRIIIDFATDVKRVSLEGKRITFGKEPNYTLEKAKVLLKELFKNHKLTIYKSKVPEYLTKSNPPYKLSCKFLLVVADKK